MDKKTKIMLHISEILMLLLGHNILELTVGTAAKGLLLVFLVAETVVYLIGIKVKE